MVTAEAQTYIDAHKLEGLMLSSGWLWKLLKRLRIVKRKATKISQKSPDSFEKEIKEFLSLVDEHK